MSWNRDDYEEEPDSDVCDVIVTIRAQCPKCKRIETTKEVVEELHHYGDPDADGVYHRMPYGECPTCLFDAEPLDEEAGLSPAAGWQSAHDGQEPTQEGEE